MDNDGEDEDRGGAEDRIMIIPCSGTCGRTTSYAEDMKAPVLQKDHIVETWNELAPTSWMYIFLAFSTHMPDDVKVCI